MTERAVRRGALDAAFLAIALAPLAACPGSVDVAEAVREIEERYGVTVEYEIGPDFLPAEWQAPPAEGRAEPITDRALKRYLRLLPSWLDKYPTTVLNEDLKGVRLCGRLEFYGVAYAGTSTEDHVYLVNDPRESGITDRFLELTFHHEFSSLLMYRHLFPVYDWADANPAGFEYMTEWDDVLEAVDSRPSMEGSAELYERGLLAEYGLTNLENDVNLYAEVTFTEPRRMKQLIGTYPVVRAKYDVLKSFYSSISPEFESWFAQIG